MASPWSFTQQLLSSNPEGWRAATQSPFLRAAASGKLEKKTLGAWLANDRLYTHAYAKAAGRLLSLVNLPEVVPDGDNIEVQLVDWVCDALASIRKEERWFINTARRYGLDVDLPTDGNQPARVRNDAKLQGLMMFEKLFRSVQATQEGGNTPPVLLPWLEGAVILWGTERVYLEAWSWAKKQMPQDMDNSSKFDNDADGGASRKEFIPNWSSDGFSEVVRSLGDILDKSARQTLAQNGSLTELELLDRVQGTWNSLLAAEEAFWPALNE